MSLAEVLPFSPENFHAALANANASAGEIAGHGPAKYLQTYLEYMKVASIVVEDPYTDADFLDDYTSYYARCYSAFGRRCKRLHFFRCELTEETFRGLLRTPGEEHKRKLQRDYLGFIVARPLPQTIIGRCVLKTYDDDGGTRRHFPVNRWYNINLFGLSIHIDGLAYQEQDTVLAACATVALWVSLSANRNSIWYNHAHPSRDHTGSHTSSSFRALRPADSPARSASRGDVRGDSTQWPRA